MTPAHRIRIATLCLTLRPPAEQVGPLHAWWDLIHDGEALLQGKETLLRWTAETWIAHAKDALGEEKR